MVRILSSYDETAGAVLDLVERPTVVAAMYPMQPDDLLARLLAEADRRKTPVRLYAADLTGRFPFVRTEWLASGQVELVTIGGKLSRRIARYADSMPCSLWEISRRLADGTIPVDLFVGRSAPPDVDGYCSFGPVVAYAAAAAEAARHRVLDLNQAVLSVPGYRGLAMDEVTLAVDSGASAVPELPVPVVGEAARAIGRRISELIPDGATLQLGIGTIPEALCGALTHRRDLGIHSGAIPEGAIPLLRAGVITGRRKSVDRGSHVTTSLLGSGRLYRYAAEPANRIEMRPVAQTHDPDTLRALDRLIAVNSALEVDLSGQANAETVNGARFSSPGGQVDFMHAGHLSDGGASIMAITARSRGGASRIVSRLSDPYSVTSQRNDVDFVVTEFGVADLRGRSLRERARNLIAIADPRVRDTLRAQTRQADNTGFEED